MALKGKVETEFEIKVSADKFYNVFRSQAHQVPNATPDIIQGVDVHEGDWKTHGSVKIWKYTVEGNAEVFKEKVEFDDANRKVSLVGVEGDVMRYYKNIKPIYQVTPKGDGSVAKLSIEYEKLREDVPAPDKYLTMMVNITKDIDAHLVKAK
ncbi:MLP-like protein 43 [Morella rubra]|uniref:MLP-like protein 43 n=1 Tax=Morella rubra TaxID=262757 RepID=A0A6A1UZD5_9ROSI|nr:MLP-like protein 43 [Morella rubra]KAB1211914.1 MLP-like protein 43 [Morella rubra]